MAGQRTGVKDVEVSELLLSVPPPEDVQVPVVHDGGRVRAAANGDVPCRVYSLPLHCPGVQILDAVHAALLIVASEQVQLAVDDCSAVK